MAAPDGRIEPAESNRTLIIAVAIAAAVVIAGVFGFLFWAISTGPTAGVALQGAIRAGSPEFEKNKPNIVLDEPEGFEAKRALGDLTMTLRTTVRNLTGKTLTGLEIRGAVVDYEGKPIKEKRLIVLPNDNHPELAPNKTMTAQMMLDGMKDTDPRANIQMEVTAFRFKE
jgi:hypothetical protein